MAATPNAYFGSALITGANNRISVSRVPVINSAGAVTYKDLTFNFDVSSAGVLSMLAFNPTITASPSLITSGFKQVTQGRAWQQVYRNRSQRDLGDHANCLVIGVCFWRRCNAVQYELGPRRDGVCNPVTHVFTQPELNSYTYLTLIF